MTLRALSLSLVVTFGIAMCSGSAGSSVQNSDLRLIASIKSQDNGLITFHLENITIGSVECRPETWVLIVDGKKLTDSGMIFGNGPGPVDGYKTLRAGASFEFAKALGPAYFQKNKKDTVQWVGAGFKSNVLTFRYRPPRQLGIPCAFR